MEKVYHKELLTIMGGLGASLVAQLVKNPPANAGDLGSIPGLGRSPGEGKSYLLQCSGLENSMDWGRKESDLTEQLSLSFSLSGE